MSDTVRLRNGLLIHGGHTGIWAALGRGFYEEEHIDCLITRGFGSQRTLADVAAKEVEFGEVDLSVMWMARRRGLPVRGVGLLYHRAQHVLFSLKQAGISSPADLRGKTIAITEADAGYLLFPAFLDHAGLALRDVKTVAVRAEEKVPTLLAGKVDALLTYVINGPAVEAGAALKGWTVRGLLWADHGFDPLSSGFVAPETLLGERPDLVRRFLRATYRGIAWALSHPEEAADLFARHNPHIDNRLARLQWKRTLPFIMTDDSLREGLGAFSDDKLKNALRALRKLSEEGEDPAGAAFTNDFLPEKALRLPARSGVPSP